MIRRPRANERYVATSLFAVSSVSTTRRRVVDLGKACGEDFARHVELRDPLSHGRAVLRRLDLDEDHPAAGQRDAVEFAVLFDGQEAGAGVS